MRNNDTLKIEGKSRYTFCYQAEDQDKEITIAFDGSAEIEEVIENIESFISACGYVLPAGTYLSLITDDEEQGEEDGE